MNRNNEYSTGIEGLDHVIDHMRMGDNVVWQVDTIDDYFRFALPYAETSLTMNNRVVYMRFAAHEPILTADRCSVIYTLDSFSGFESFSAEVHSIITHEGRGICYVFDCLSDLQSAWATDLMIGNFFMVTCPFLYEMGTIAYFSILRNSLSFKTIARIRETTQVLIDVYNSRGNYYIHPLKAQNRYSPTMFFPHLLKNSKLTPITNSVDAARLIDHIQQKGYVGTRRTLDYWDRLFLRAEDLQGSIERSNERNVMLEDLCRIMMGKDPRILGLAVRNFSLEDFLNIRDRLVGTGYIGGKTVGMLLARKILANSGEPRWNELLEPHDSFYIGSDVFYSYIVHNGWWRVFMEHKTPEKYFTAAAKLKELMQWGTFPEEIYESFQHIVDYFGQSPYIVRSSSLLEDAFGNAFAGKYESFFCVNQGPPSQRFAGFIDAVRKVYASTMDEDALAYRLQRGLDRLDEQMALLVQRVSGSYHADYFFPNLAGVGLSYNTFVWKSGIDPKGGMLRLIMGLGTRAVNRTEGDYPSIIALDAPMARPHHGREDARRYSQHNVDVLDIKENEICTIPLNRIISEKINIPLDILAERDTDAEKSLADMGKPGSEVWVLTFANLLSETSFAADMKKILTTIEKNYDYPVDIEFTVNFTQDREYHINLLQCRPQQTRRHETVVEVPSEVDQERILFQSRGHFLGGSIIRPLHRIIYIDPEHYSSLPLARKYDVARLVGRLNHQLKRESIPVLLMGPGRWGTSTPALGVPVRFSEINNISVLVEIAHMRDNLIPELSFGTHFFQDLVETDIFYVALFPEKEGVFINNNHLMSRENILSALLPDDARYADTVRVYDTEGRLTIAADIVSQRVLCFGNAETL